MKEPEKARFPDPSERMPTIMIVEDELLIRTSLSDFLQECGFKVIEAGNADEAIQLLETRALSIDLVMTDVRMPGSTDGFGLAKWIRENRCGLPVLIASGDTGKANVAHELCADEPFFKKPYDLNMVVAHIRQTLGVQKSNKG